MSKSHESVCAYVPCFNNAATVAQAVTSLLEQSIPPLEVLVIDDGSTDDSANSVVGLPVKVIRHPVNLGRGSARARAMHEAQCDLVVCCDATNALDPDFIEGAMNFFQEPLVAGVFGRFSQGSGITATLRWRARHLYHLGADNRLQRYSNLTTHGAIVRKSWVSKAGGFNTRLRHSEDADLGERLLAAGADVVFDPSLRVRSLVDNSVSQLLERYGRWNSGKDGRVPCTAYARNVLYSIKGMALADLRAGDPLAACISMLCPHHQFWHTRFREFRAQIAAKWQK